MHTITIVVENEKQATQVVDSLQRESWEWEFPFELTVQDSEE